MEHKPADPKAENESGSESKASTGAFIVLAIALVLILLGIVFVPKYLSQKEKEDNAYNGFDFTKDGDFWYTTVSKGNQPFTIPFYYHPSELKDVVVEEGIRDKFFAMQQNNGSIFISIDPNAGNNKVVIAGVEVAKITGDRYGLLNVPTRSAFLREPEKTTVNTQTPVLTCANTSVRVMVVGFLDSDKNLVSSQGNCIVLEAENYNESIRVADRLMYNLLGIMD